MNIYKLIRISSTAWGTFGVWLDANERPMFVTLEDEWLNNAIGKSCVPETVYVCEPYKSQKFGDVWQLQDTAPRKAILIHAGNTNEDTRGCILPGKMFGKLGADFAVLDSRKALDSLRALEKDKTFVLTIRNAW